MTGEDPQELLIGSGRDEAEHIRLDRNLTELLGELRVALPGVQVLFAFLLTAPFNQRFPELTAVEEGLYLAALLLAGAASALLIAPVAAHRLTFRRQRKAFVVVIGNRLAIAGLTCLALSMTAAVSLVVAFVFGTAPAIVAAGLGTVLFGVLWYGLPLTRGRA